jgi:hypothetical protein
LLLVQSHARVVTPQKLCPRVVTRQAHWLPAPSCPRTRTTPSQMFRSIVRMPWLPACLQTFLPLR